MAVEFVPFTELLSAIVDNRGRTCPVGKRGIPLIATNCIDDSRLYPRYETSRFVDEETYQNWFRGHPQPGDILFVCKGSPGRTNWVPDPVDFCIAQDMVAVRADAKKVYPKYLFAALRSDVVQNQIANMHVGTMIPHFKKGDFDKLQIPLVDPKSQKFIGDIYYLLSQKVELNRRNNEALEAMARTLFKSWFVDFDGVGESELVESELGLIPKGWRVGSIADAVEIIGGGTPKTSVDEYWNGDIPWFSVVDTPAESDVFVVETEKSITEAGLNGSSVRLIGKGTTVISARGTVGNLAIAGRDMTFNQSCYALKGKNGAGDYFVYLSAQRMVEQLKSMAHGSVFSTITRQTFDAISVVLPPDSTFPHFEGKVSSLFDAILANVNQSRTLAQLRDALLPKLLSGELRVKERGVG